MSHLVRADLPHQLYTAVRHLSVDLTVPMNQLLVEGLILLLRYHDRGSGLPDPLPPVSTTEKGGVL